MNHVKIIVGYISDSPSFNIENMVEDWLRRNEDKQIVGISVSHSRDGQLTHVVALIHYRDSNWDKDTAP